MNLNKRENSVKLRFERSNDNESIPMQQSYVALKPFVSLHCIHQILSFEEHPKYDHQLESSYLSKALLV